jgi:mRNA-degrading endonuclease YafQ of YafQ-DinJ toxin-antitoxin module
MRSAMSELSDSTVANKFPEKAVLADILKEVKQTPQEQWEILLQFIRQFRLSLKMQPSSTEAWNTVMNQIRNENPLQKDARDLALSELLQSWEEEADEQEQKETWEYIKQALNQDRLSNRLLFP